MVAKTIKDILDGGGRQTCMFYSRYGLRYIQYVSNQVMRLVHIDRSELPPNTGIYSVFFSRHDLQKMYNINNTVPVETGWDADYSKPTLICSGVEMTCDAYRDGFLSTLIESGAFILEVSASKNKVLNILNESDQDEIIISICDDSMLIDGKDVKISGRKDLKISCHIPKEDLLDSLQFIDGNVVYLAFKGDSENPELTSVIMIHDSKDKYCCAMVDNLDNRTNLNDQSHRDGNFKAPMVTKKASRGGIVNKK